MSVGLISIIIPAYNAEAYVAEAIESALGQTYPHKEVIVIDDGSTDGSLDVIKSFGEWIRWETGPNRGGSAARNRGLELAQGEFVQFLDADDLLHPQKLERQVAVAEQHPDAIVYCDYVVEEFKTGRVVEIPRRECQGKDPVCFSVQAERLQTSAPLHRRQWLLDAGGFDESLPCCQEYDLHLRLACHGVRWRHMREILYTVRQRGRSVSSDYRKVLQHHGRIFTRALEQWESRTGRDDSIRACFAGRLCSSARLLLRFGDRKTAIAYFTAAREIHPSGGIAFAYRPATRLLRRFLGPVLLEYLVMLRRRIVIAP